MIKYIIILILLVSSCNKKYDKQIISKNKNIDSLFIELVNNDFLQFVDSNKIESIKQKFIKEQYTFSPEIYRYLNIDAEELAEGSFNFFSTELTNIIKKRGLELSFSTTENFEKLHEVKINNDKFILFDDIHLDDYSFWDEAPRRFFRKINKELEKNEIVEQFYLIYSGNDLGAVLLTKKQHSLIAIINEGNKYEIPYKP